jgi:predicted aconitase with swiveling domain
MAEARTLVAGTAEGPALVLDEPLSLWGGLDPETGSIIDTRHPQRGANVAGRVLVMPAGRGSSSSSSVLAEAIRAGTGPAAIVLGEPDPILALGAIVARELFGTSIPVVVTAESGLRTDELITVRADESGVELLRW